MATQNLENENESASDLMAEYKFVHVGKISLSKTFDFQIEIFLKEALKWERALYIFVFDDKITRVGSSKGPLGKRMMSWNRDITNAIHKMNGLPAKKTVTPGWEAEAWCELLNAHGPGQVYAREATSVTTPVGTFRAYMDEESVLIIRHKPPMNRHTNC